MRYCRGCEKWLRADDFAKSSRNRDGRQSKCRLCQRRYREINADRLREYKRQYEAVNVTAISKRVLNYRDRNAEVISEKKRKYYSENPHLIRGQNQRRRARKRNLPYEVVRVREVVARDGAWCWMCGVELADWDPVHLDHLIPLAADAGELGALGVVNPGSVLANTALACSSCNSRKWSRVLVCAVARYLGNVTSSSLGDVA